MTVHPPGARTFLSIETKRGLLLSGPTEPDSEDRAVNNNAEASMMENYRTGRDITDGIPENALDGLTVYHREIVVTLLARASERAYRRGFQQGVTIGEARPKEIRADLIQWRYGVSTDDSPWADAPRIETAGDRLFTENKRLHRLGLKVSIADALVPEIRNDPTYVPRG